MFNIVRLLLFSSYSVFTNKVPLLTTVWFFFSLYLRCWAAILHCRTVLQHWACSRGCREAPLISMGEFYRQGCQSNSAACQGCTDAMVVIPCFCGCGICQAVMLKFRGQWNCNTVTSCSLQSVRKAPFIVSDLSKIWISKTKNGNVQQMCIHEPRIWLYSPK